MGLVEGGHSMDFGFHERGFGPVMSARSVMRGEYKYL